jgi:hypothetical protein
MINPSLLEFLEEIRKFFFKNSALEKLHIIALPNLLLEKNQKRILFPTNSDLYNLSIEESQKGISSKKFRST